MAYINKDNVIDIIDNSADIQEVKSCVFMLENADVIERFKVDKAIEELQHIKVYDRTRTARLVSLPEVFEILKKNIGE